jgi:hypothetical protein
MIENTLNQIINLCTEGGDPEVALTEILKLSLKARKKIKKLSLKARKKIKKPPIPPKSRRVNYAGVPCVDKPKKKINYI